MFVRRRSWHYNTLCNHAVRRIEFAERVSASYVKAHIAKQFNKMVHEIWPR